MTDCYRSDGKNKPGSVGKACGRGSAASYSAPIPRATTGRRLRGSAAGQDMTLLTGGPLPRAGTVRASGLGARNQVQRAFGGTPCVRFYDHRPSRRTESRVRLAPRGPKWGQASSASLGPAGIRTTPSKNSPLVRACRSEQRSTLCVAAGNYRLACSKRPWTNSWPIRAETEIPAGGYPAHQRGGRVLGTFGRPKQFGSAA